MENQNTEQQIPEAQSEQSQTPQASSFPRPGLGKLSDKFKLPKLAVLGIGFVILLVLLGGVYFLGKNNSRPTYQTPVQTMSPTPNPISFKTSVDTSSWKTYINTTRGYSFKYPTDYVVRVTQKTKNTHEGVYLTKNLKTEDNGTGGTDVVSGTEISFLIYPSYDLSKNNLRHALGSDKTSDVIIGERKFIKLDASNTYGIFYFYKFSPDVLTISQDLGFKNSDTESSKYEKDLYDILSTFKFTDQTSSADTSDWTTYTNTSMKISVEIPKNYEVISQTSSKIVLGSRPTPSEDVIPYLTISKNIETPYQSLPLCEKAPSTFPCKENEVTSTKISGKNVDLVRITSGPDQLDELIIVTDLETSSAKEIKMSVAGGGLSKIFDHIKSTLKFN